MGGALDLAAACDLRVCAADAFFTVQEIHIGMAADLGVLQRLQRLLPQGLARELAYTGDRLGAERALATGFVNAVVADGDALLAHARKLAASIAAKSPLAIAASKMALNHARDHSTADSLAADDAAAERGVRRRRDGARDRRLAGEEAGGVRSAGRDRQALRPPAVGVVTTQFAGRVTLLRDKVEQLRSLSVRAAGDPHAGVPSTCIRR